MASRRDQLQSYQFLTQRVLSAFVMRETDPAQSPLRRGIGAVFAGVMIAVMVGAGFGVYGLLTKVGSNNWKTDGAVVIEKETGAPFVYQGGELHPMLNYASALLATGSASRAVFQESANALSRVPRGVMLGIPYAPDSVPDAGHTLGGPWTLCTASATNSTDSTEPATTLALSVAPSGARVLGNQGLLVRDPAIDSTYLIWHGNRFRIAASVLPALFGVVTPLAAGTAWLNGLPLGADIKPIPIAGTGSTSPAAPKYKIGDVLVTQVGTGGLQYWLVFADGLAPITELQKDIVVGQGSPRPIQISVLRASGLPHSSQLPSAGQIPQPSRPPALAQPASPSDRVCALLKDATSGPVVSLGGTLPLAGTPTEARTGNGGVLADRVLVPAGHAEVVTAMASSTSAGGGYYLVTDLGIRYSIPNGDVLKMLGYQPSDAVGMPAGLVRLIPSGPTLDPVAAAAPADASVADGH